MSELDTGGYLVVEATVSGEIVSDKGTSTTTGRFAFYRSGREEFIPDAKLEPGQSAGKVVSVSKQRSIRTRK